MLFDNQGGVWNHDGLNFSLMERNVAGGEYSMTEMDRPSWHENQPVVTPRGFKLYKMKKYSLAPHRRESGESHDFGPLNGSVVSYG